METESMGKVLVSARIENLDDVFGARKGEMTEAQIRRVEVTNALIDFGASGLLMPLRMIKLLGLDAVRTRNSRTISGEHTITIYEAVRLSINGRYCITDVAGIADHLPVIVGQLPLEAMDWVIDMKGQKLIGNPEHGGEEMIEIY